MTGHVYDNKYFSDKHQMNWDTPYDLKEAEIDGYCTVKINHEWLRLKITSDGKDGSDIWGIIGVFEYNITEIHKRLLTGKIEAREGYAIGQFYNADYDYLTSQLITRVRDYVHRVKIGKKDVILIINYLEKLWTCQIIGYYPNPHAKEVGGKYESLQHYIEHQENILRIKEIESNP